MRNTHMSTPRGRYTRVVQPQRTAPRPLVPCVPPTAQLACTPAAVYAARANLHAHQAQQRAIGQALGSMLSAFHELAKQELAFRMAVYKGAVDTLRARTPQWAAYTAAVQAARANTAQSVKAQAAAIDTAKQVMLVSLRNCTTYQAALAALNAKHGLGTK